MKILYTNKCVCVCAGMWSWFGVCRSIPNYCLALLWFKLTCLPAAVGSKRNGLRCEINSITRSAIRVVHYEVPHNLKSPIFFPLVIGIVLFNWTRQKQTRYDGCIFFTICFPFTWIPIKMDFIVCQQFIYFHRDVIFKIFT